MRNIALHMLDILENCAKAGAPSADVSLRVQDSSLILEVSDDGPGLPVEIAADPTDPYRTTRKERRVGLGLSLLRHAAEMTGGGVTVSSIRGSGVRVRAEFNLGSIDACPVGDVVEALLTAAIAWPELDLTVRQSTDEPCLDMAIVKAELGDVPLSHPTVRTYIRDRLEEGLGPLVARTEAIIPELNNLNLAETRLDR